jgi:HrpA-like RNA helicase
MSATGDLDQLRQWFGSAPGSMITLPSIRHRREIIHATTPSKDYRLDVCRRVHEVLQNQSKYEKGDILIFVPGVEEIREVMDRVKHVRDGCETKSQQDQVMADTQLSPLRPRKIIVATNIAETSLTFPFLNIVIDTGLVKVNSYDPTHGVEWLLLKSVSKAQADQRAGRVGRTRPGFVFRLYTLNSYVRFDQYPVPAIARESFDSSLLAWLAMGHRDVARDALPGWSSHIANAMLLTPVPALPSRQHRLRAVDNLRLLGALKPSFELTVHGEQMSRLPVKPMVRA